MKNKLLITINILLLILLTFSVNNLKGKTN